MRPNRQINVCIRYEIPGCKAWITKTSWCTAILTWLTRRLSSVITHVPGFASRTSDLVSVTNSVWSLVLASHRSVSSLDIEGEIKTLCSPQKKMFWMFWVLLRFKYLKHRQPECSKPSSRFKPTGHRKYRLFLEPWSSPYGWTAGCKY